MGSSDTDGYCSFTKAVEHLGDRWCLLILRELVQSGPQGFNALAAGLPGHVSRSVLRDRLRQLRQVGVIRQDESGRAQARPYRLTDAGEGLIPVLLALRGWSETWLPDDPEMAERDPDLVFGWLGERIRRDALPQRQTIVEVTMQIDPPRHCWYVLEQGAEPFGCFEDPLLDEARYVYVQGGAVTLLGLARGRRRWQEAIAKGLVDCYGHPDLIRQLPAWFDRPDRDGAGRRGTGVRASAQGLEGTSRARRPEAARRPAERSGTMAAPHGNWRR